MWMRIAGTDKHFSQLVGCTVNMHKFLLFCCTFDTQSVFAAPSSQYKSFRMELWDLFFLKSALIKSTRRKTNLKDHIFKCSHTRDKHIYLVSIQREKCAPFNHHTKHKKIHHYKCHSWTEPVFIRDLKGFIQVSNWYDMQACYIYKQSLPDTYLWAPWHIMHSYFWLFFDRVWQLS